jgi:hypothetical protein
MLGRGYPWTAAEDNLVRRGGVPDVPGRTRKAVLSRRSLLKVSRRRSTVRRRVLRALRHRGPLPTPQLTMLARIESPNRRAIVWTALRALRDLGVVRRRLVRRVAVWELVTDPMSLVGCPDAVQQARQTHPGADARGRVEEEQSPGAGGGQGPDREAIEDPPTPPTVTLWRRHEEEGRGR